jgi:hypothetical protein
LNENNLEQFDQWHQIDGQGWTIAHVAAMWIDLPRSFNQWELTTGEGDTVAHIAAEHGQYMKNFNKWELQNNNNKRTVASIFMEQLKQHIYKVAEDGLWY